MSNKVVSRRSPATPRAILSGDCAAGVGAVGRRVGKQPGTREQAESSREGNAPGASPFHKTFGMQRPPPPPYRQSFAPRQARPSPAARPRRRGRAGGKPAGTRQRFGQGQHSTKEETQRRLNARRPMPAGGGGRRARRRGQPRPRPPRSRLARGVAKIEPRATGGGCAAGKPR